MLKRACKVSHDHGEVYFRQKQRLATVFTGNTLLHRKQSRKDAEDFIVDKINNEIHQHAILQKLNSPTTPPRNHNK